MQVFCYWDMDNKQLMGTEEIERVVPHLRQALSALGSVNAIKAFGNTHCFNYLPPPERQAIKDRKARRHALQLCLDVQVLERATESVFR